MFASSWLNRPEVPESIKGSLYTHYTSELDGLLNGLPEMFHAKIMHIRNHLPELFAADYPMTINHMDLDGTSMFFDTEGNLTGIVDWATAHISPFGLSLFAIENLLGYREPKPMSRKWNYLKNQAELRQHFYTVLFQHLGWQTPEMIDQMMQKMLLAASLGCFLQYGRNRRTGQFAIFGSYNFAFMMEHMNIVSS
jgi:hypothetical protein